MTDSSNYEPENHRRRIIEELCAVIGLNDNADMIVKGGGIRIDKSMVWLAYEEALDYDHMFVYVDLGLPSNPLDAYKRLLKLNFELGAGIRGVMSLHPENEHVMYTFRYPLMESSTGQALLDWVLRIVGGSTTENLKELRKSKYP